MKKLLYLIVLFLVCNACGEDDLEGHWHLKKVSSIEEEKTFNVTTVFRECNDFAIIDLKDDGGIWNANKYGVRGIPVSINKIKKCIILGEIDSYTYRYKYKVSQDSFHLFTENGLQIYSGFQCREECCNKQEEEFMYDIQRYDLPIENNDDLSVEYDLDPKLEQRILIGYPKENLFDCAPSLRMSVNEKFIFLDDIPLVIESRNTRTPKESRNKIQYTIYADKDAEMKMIISLVRRLNERRIYKVNLAVRGDTNIENDFELRLRRIKLDDIVDLGDDMKLSTYLEITKS